MTAAETEARVKGIEKSMDEMQSAVRRIFQENTATLTTLSKLSEDVATLKADVALIKKNIEDKAKKELSLGRTNY